MADIDKILNKGNDFLDRAEGKAKERQAMSENPEEENQGITAKDMAGAGVDYAKDIAANKIQDKAVDKFQEKFLNKDGDSVLKEGAEANKGEEKSAVDDVKNKYLNKNSNSDNLLNDSKNEKGAKSSLNGGKNSSTGGNQGNDVGQTSNSGRKNAFGDSKNPSEKTADNFKKNPTAGANAAKSGADIAKEGAKDATKELATGAASGVGVAEKALAGDAKGAAIKGAGELAGATANTFVPGSGGVVKKGVEKGLEEGDKVLKEINGEDTGDKGSNIFAKLGCFGCLGIIGIIVAPILFIPTTVVSLIKVIGAAVESATTPIDDFNSFVKDKLTEKLGMDFGDFDFEDIGQDATKMETYAKFKDLFFTTRVDISAFKDTDNSYTTYVYESDGTKYKDSTYENVTHDPEALVLDYLPLYKIFAGLEAVHKDEIAEELKNYFLHEAKFEFEIVDDVIVTYKDVIRTKEKIVSLIPYKTEEVEYPDRVRITKTTPKLVLKKATTLTDVLTFKWEEQVEGENKTWVMTGVESEINTEVIAIFNSQDWSKAEISSFEYIADCNPINSLYDAGMYGFTSTFQMPIDNTIIAVPYDANSHAYIEVSGGEGTAVKAAADGIVTKVDYDAINGHYIQIKISSGSSEHIITYAKLKEAPTLTQGSTVTKSQVIGYMGDEFLKVEVKDKNGKNVDPNVFLSSTYTSAIEHVENDAEIGAYSMKSYKQYDYGIVGGVSMTDAACGPTSLAMVLSSQKCGSQTVSPTEIASLARSKGLWSSAGASWDMFKQLKSYYGYEVKQYSINPTGYRTSGTASPNISTVLDAISKGDPVIMLIHGKRYGYESKFTKGGHFIVIDGYIKDGLVRVLDPASSKLERKQATLEELFSGAVQAYIFG